MSIVRSRLNRPARPDSRRVRGSWLSLFAMLMIFIGPLVSQSMPMDHRAMSTDMGMSMAMDSSADCHSGSHHESSPSLHVIWEKCGYCSLFFHCPALPQALSLLNTEAAPVSGSLIVQPRQGHARQTVFPGARTRAPPPFIVV
ncbi:MULTISPECIES: DUF2946 domain-containing protein [Pseudomonas]|uniref:DUF2946 domain-containing protein n=1 Tax=Pseudomonas sp. Hg7Tf TaxID=3236988 RepID=A0AB39I0X9_9PSED|nr:MULTISPECIES: DUF2946 domain-containing protein [Pseudomonas]KJK09127.1 hypothetical protein UB47_05375 [Pseudomonas sp. 5]MDD1975582.1 DUF2946 domain-containing protein [Pseudomonas putida]MDH2560115.1 DUF2946 domain-containing protein [Pseudomonas sp. Hg5Tf]QYX45908.1 DUF2946 domain-containing protein [Pseudomonas sp. S11A 273]